MPLIVLLLTLGGFVGCGDSGPELTPVEGVLTLDGEPLANKSLVFTPLDGTPGNGGGGYSDGEGRYSVRASVAGATEDYSGLVPGSYRVTVFESMIGGGDIADDPSGAEPAAALAPTSGGGDSEIPVIYGTEQSPLVIEVESSGEPVNVDLKSNP